MAEIITLEEAVKLTRAFQESEIGRGQTISAKFEKGILDQILDQEGCEGINIYTALNDEGQITFVLIGYDNENNNITEGKIADWAETNPPYKPNNSIL